MRWIAWRISPSLGGPRRVKKRFYRGSEGDGGLSKEGSVRIENGNEANVHSKSISLEGIVKERDAISSAKINLVREGVEKDR